MMGFTSCSNELLRSTHPTLTEHSEVHLCPLGVFREQCTSVPRHIRDLHHEYLRVLRGEYFNR
jgi:hypothetical protein